MKKIFLLTILNFILLGIHAQTISNKVIASTGSFFSNASFSVSQTIGQPITNTLTAGGITMNQGFQQLSDICYFSLMGGVDSVFVCGTSATLTGTCCFATYLWSNGQTTPSITVSASGWYKCTVTNGVTGGTCTGSDSVYLRISNVVPSAPTAITITALQTNVCGARKYRYSVPVSTAASATGYLWAFQGPLYTTAFVDSGSLNSRVLTVTYTSNAVASLQDSVKCLYTSICGNSPKKAARLTNTALNVPAAPASIIITALQTNVCGARQYRYTAPVLPAATSTATAATGYFWDVLGFLPASLQIDSGSFTSSTWVGTFSSNAAATIADSVRVYYTSACGNSLRKASKFTNSLLTTPIPASVTITSVQTNVCNARIYRYTAPVFPAATATAPAPTGYLWTIPPIGLVGATGSLDSGTLTGRIIRIRYTSNNLASVGDSVKVAYTSTCGVGLPKATKLTNTATIAPAAPTAITMQLVSDICGARVYRYIAPNLTAATTTAVAPNGWEWSWVGLLASTAVIDSGTISSQKINLKFSSNAAAAIGDSMKIRFTTPCTAPSLFKAVKFSNLLKASCRSALIAKLTTPVTTADTYRKLDAIISPNPSTDWFKVSIQTISEEPITIRVMDMQGKVLKQMVYKTGKEFKINASWIPGIYLLEVMQSKQKILKKLIKQ